MSHFSSQQWNVLASIAFSVGLPLFATEPAKPPTTAIVRKQLAKNLQFEVEGTHRRVVLQAEVCLREGALEGLLCRAHTKEHEYILAADVDARQVHAALIAAGAKPGSPVQFAPKYAPAMGASIQVMLRYRKDGQSVTVPAGDWIQDAKDKRPLKEPWVFGGSRFVPDPDNKDKPPFYLANQGDLICVCNMESAMLDLSVRSPKRFDDRRYVPRAEVIPPVQTPVEVILEVAQMAGAR